MSMAINGEPSGMMACGCPCRVMESPLCSTSPSLTEKVYLRGPEVVLCANICPVESYELGSCQCSLFCSGNRVFFAIAAAVQEVSIAAHPRMCRGIL